MFDLKTTETWEVVVMRGGRDIPAASIITDRRQNGPKDAGFRNSGVRMEVAGYLGVRPAVELGRLCAACCVLEQSLMGY